MGYFMHIMQHPYMTYYLYGIATGLTVGVLLVIGYLHRSLLTEKEQG